MQITINGEIKNLNQPITVADLLDEMKLKGRIAVELNKEILPRSKFDKYRVNNGDVLEIVRAIGGG
jgi:thiamine biosynthesis protein ThiS